MHELCSCNCLQVILKVSAGFVDCTSNAQQPALDHNVHNARTNVDRGSNASIRFEVGQSSAPMPTPQPAEASLDGSNKRKLQPVWCNRPCMSCFSLQHASQFARVLQRLAARDPLLVYVLQKVVNQVTGSARAPPSTLHITAGRHVHDMPASWHASAPESHPSSVSATQYLSDTTVFCRACADPQSPIPKLVGLRLTGIWWMEDDSTSLLEPALMLQIGVPYDASEVVPRVLRDYCTLSVLPTIVTVRGAPAMKTQPRMHAGVARLAQQPCAVGVLVCCQRCAVFRNFKMALHAPTAHRGCIAAFLRSCCAVSHFLQVVTFQGQVLYQNAASLAYLGDFTHNTQKLDTAEGHGPLSTLAMGFGISSHVNSSFTIPGMCFAGSGAAGSAQGLCGPAQLEAQLPPQRNLFTQLFCMDLEAMEEMLEEVALSNRWAGVVQVPFNLKRHMKAEARRSAMAAPSHHQSMLQRVYASRVSDMYDSRGSTDKVAPHRQVSVPASGTASAAFGSLMEGHQGRNTASTSLTASAMNLPDVMPAASAQPHMLSQSPTLAGSPQGGSFIASDLLGSHQAGMSTGSSNLQQQQQQQIRQVRSPMLSAPALSTGSTLGVMLNKGVASAGVVQAAGFMQAQELGHMLPSATHPHLQQLSDGAGDWGAEFTSSPVNSLTLGRAAGGGQGMLALTTVAEMDDHEVDLEIEEDHSQPRGKSRMLGANSDTNVVPRTAGSEQLASPTPATYSSPPLSAFGPSGSNPGNTPLVPQITLTSLQTANASRALHLPKRVASALQLMEQKRLVAVVCALYTHTWCLCVCLLALHKLGNCHRRSPCLC